MRHTASPDWDSAADAPAGLIPRRQPHADTNRPRDEAGTGREDKGERDYPRRAAGVGNGGVSPPHRRGEQTLGARKAEEATGTGSRGGSCLVEARRKGRDAGDKERRKETRACGPLSFCVYLHVRPICTIRPV
jgi:hypothetical protein